MGFSVAGADSDPTSELATSEKIVIDGVDVYRSESPDGGPAAYDLEPPSEADIAMIQEVPNDLAGAGKWQTTGDLAACRFLVQRPGSVVEGCALMMAQERYGDLDLAEGPAQLVYSVCGREPAPGEIKDCGGVVIEEAQVAAALDELRAALAEEK